MNEQTNEFEVSEYLALIANCGHPNNKIIIMKMMIIIINK